MQKRVQFEMELPADMAKLRLPKGVEKRLHKLLDKQDEGKKLTAEEQREAEGLTELVDLLSLLRLRVQRIL